MKSHHQFKYSHLSIVLMALFAYQSDTAIAVDNQQKNTTENPEKTTELQEIRVEADRGLTDERGKNRVYSRSIGNVFISKQELESYRGTSIGDIFKGANGVYSTDARNSGALDPNIRGIQGQGRVPVIIDGTEQSMAIFMNTAGIAGRSYLDPNLVGRVTVEKGPAILRGMQSGIGGTVIVNTLEADDILLEGKNYGIDIRMDAASNSTKQADDPNYYFGKDYRDIPGVYTTGQEVSIGMTDSIAKRRTDWPQFNGKDISGRVAAAYKNDVVEAIAAYSHRKRGNYFAGKGGSQRYLYKDWVKVITGENEEGDAKKFYDGVENPFIADMYRPGREVPNTSSELKSWLFKTTFHLPHEQQLKLGYIESKHQFGETIPWLAEWMAKIKRHDPNTDPETIYNLPESKIKNKAYSLQYQWNPQNNPWINFQAGAWMTQLHSERHQSGNLPYGILGQGGDEFGNGGGGDRNWNTWVQCHNGWYDGNPDKDYYCSGMSKDNPPQRQPDPDGKFKIQPAGLQIDDNKRFGFNLSNQFQLRPNLKLTLAASMQHERLRGSNAPGFETTGFNAGSRYIGPRSGTRREYNASALLDWQATPWLDLSAGVNYTKFWAYDDALAEHRRKKEWPKKAPQTHVIYDYARLLNDEDAALARDYYDQWGSDVSEKAEIALNQRMEALRQQDQVYFNILETDDINKSYSDGFPAIFSLIDPNNGQELYYWKAQVLMPVKNGTSYATAKDNPFHNGKIDVRELAHNPQGLQGNYLKYLPLHEGSQGELDRGLISLSQFPESIRDQIDADRSGQVISDPNKIGDIYEAPRKIKNHAWAPMFAATISLTDNIRIYARYSEAVRFPSLYEFATNSDYMGLYSDDDIQGKPERTKNWEVGYIHDLSGFFPKLRYADIKLNYYHNNIKDYIDRSVRGFTLRFDKKILSGLELQGRVDSGRYFADVGISYRFKQKLCDRDYALSESVFYGSKYSNCVEAGFPYTLGRMSLQPRYSINLSGGARFFNEKLELGGRMMYHSSAKNKSEVQWAAQGNLDAFSMLRPFEWQPVWVFDAYAQYQFNKYGSVNVSIENISNRYYMDPLARVALPAPGRTVRLGLNLKF